MNRRPLLRLLSLCALVPVAPAALALDYERDVMPIFEEKCFDCHSAEADKVKGGLRLDDPEHFLGRFAKNDVVLPGNWDASYLFVTITRPHDSEEAMPPKDKGTPLTPEEILTVANWIHEGAKVGRESGDKGPDDLKPDDILKFKDGVMVTDTFDNSSTTPEKPMTKPEAAPEQIVREWTNREGTKIQATFQGLEGSNAVLKLPDGRIANYPLEKLSDESHATIRELSASSPAKTGE